MNKLLRAFLLCTLCLPSLVCQAQPKILNIFKKKEIVPQNQLEADSLQFVNGPWKRKIIHLGGITLRQCAFKDSNALFQSNQYVSVLVIKRSFRFDVVADTALTTVEDFMKYSKALCGVNGSFFDTSAPWNSVDYLMVDTLQLAPNQLDENRMREFHQTGTLTVSPKGRIGILKAPADSPRPVDSLDWEYSLKGDAEDVLTSGPILRVKGKDQPLENSNFTNTRNPRTAVALRKGGKTLLVVVDGRSSEAAGMTLTELQHIMRWLKADSAINMDGGGSSTMCVRKKILKPVRTVNHPTDNKMFDTHGARKVANAIVVK